ncbi:Terminase small subunit [Flavobacterium fluvii]|uniref:Terminase small subunit n=1 Tax=Flavobacterium fluvii TaxID=468056 RepID=A0A1M5FD99_9FLAO|nr:terminase small subunit [Flavobacterium fluvii]SHF89503.1 Terminase small subunit [Flavobacterium fluvii]
MKDTLTLKQEAFCQAFIRLGDKSAAYREAYNASRMKPETIHEMSSKLSSSHKVATRIKELRIKLAAIAEKKFNITAEEMLRHLNVLRNSRIDEYVEFKKGKLSLKDFNKLTPEQLMCIESIKETRFGIEIKLHGKDWTIEKINKHIGFYEKDNEQKAQTLSPEQKIERLKELKEKLLNSGI